VGIKLKNMNRNQKNWLKAFCLTIGVLGGMGLFVVGLAMFYFNYPQYFIHTFVIIFGGMALFGVIRLVKDGLDDEDNWNEYYDKTYPQKPKTKKKKETQKEFMERLDEAWVRDFGKKQ
jgi:hypothetical protein